MNSKVIFSPHMKKIHTKDGQFAWSITGKDSLFFPCGLPSPNIFTAINPYNRFDYRENEEQKPNLLIFHEESFYNPDYTMFILEGDFFEFFDKLNLLAENDVLDHLELSNGGLYALWKIDKNKFIVGAFDNNHEIIAQHTLNNLIESMLLKDNKIKSDHISGYKLNIDTIKDDTDYNYKVLKYLNLIVDYRKK